MEDFYSPISEEHKEANFSTVLQKVFYMMTAGLAVTGITSLLTIYTPQILLFVANCWQILAFAELILVIILSLNLKNMGTATCRITFYLYAILNGLTLSPIFLVYARTSIASTFFITAAMFGGAALYGHKTDKDLTKFGSFFFMALLGIIIAGIVNLFIMNSTLDFVISVIGIFLFIGITAYDIQKIKDIYALVDDNDEERMTQVVTIGALNLYLDFINIFLKILSLTGRRRK